MDERRANIDLAFRNGLKDYEVLPPPDVWSNIDNRIRRRLIPPYYLRAAAFLAIAMTMSVLAYRWTTRTSGISGDSRIALNEESTFSAPANNNKVLPVGTGAAHNSIRSFKASVIEDSPVVNEVNAEENTGLNYISLPEANLLVPVNSGLSDIVRPQSGLTLNIQNPLPLNTLSFDIVNQDYPVVDNAAKKTGRWSISALATPTYYGKINTGTDELSKQIMASEQSIVSYSGGVAMAYKLNKRFSIQSGLFYSSLGQDLDGINSFAGFQKYSTAKGGHNFEVLTTNGTVYTNNPDIFLFEQGNSNRIITNINNNVFDPQKASLDYLNNTMRQSMSYVELPVYLRYKVVDRTLDFNLIGGFSYNILVDNSVYTVIDGNKYVIGTTGDLNTFSISSSIGMGMEYKFSDKISLNLEPTFRYYLNTFNTSSNSNFHPYSFGIFSGISYKF
jgi:hypothetical protein